jgi:hypothetical protein
LTVLGGKSDISDIQTIEYRNLPPASNRPFFPFRQEHGLNLARSAMRVRLPSEVDSGLFLTWWPAGWAGSG